MKRLFVACLVLAAPLTSATRTEAQPLGTFRWQLQPYCNIVTLAVTQNGGVYRLEGTDDQCGAGGPAASVIGTAFLNPDGTVGMGLNVVAAPGGAPTPVAAQITIASLGGTWRDAAGNTGAFIFTPAAGTGGSPRPLPATVIPTTIQRRSDGGLLAGGTEGVGTIPATGAGARMMWHPAKAAFRVGRALGTEWDEAAIGLYSVGLGLDTYATGRSSVALGDGTRATGENSTAMGLASIASGTRSTAIGDNARASGLSSTAIGSSLASGSQSIAMGMNSEASGANAIAGASGVARGD